MEYPQKGEIEIQKLFYQTDVYSYIQKVDERFNRQGAMTAAMMNMSGSAASVKGQNRVGVGAGFQGQEQAVSIGYQRIINDIPRSPLVAHLLRKRVLVV